MKQYTVYYYHNGLRDFSYPVKSKNKKEAKTKADEYLKNNMGLGWYFDKIVINKTAKD